MPYIKDFGVWFNIIVGTMFSSFVLKIIYRNLQELKNKEKANSIYFKDLIAAGLVVFIYLVYLLAYIPLEYTYRLGKFAVSILYPLAIVGIFPTVFWFRDRFYDQKSRAVQFACLVLVAIHLILHIDKTLYLQGQPVGKYQLAVTNNLININSLTIIGCASASSSQKYQKIVGLDLAKQYPNLKISVITDTNLMDNFPPTDVVSRGVETLGESKNLCIFKIDL
jgi:hypothetical protein